MIREIRKVLPSVKVLPEYADVDRRIAATSDFIKENILLSSSKLDESDEYSSFLSNVLDYNLDSEEKEGSTALSGLAYYLIKLGSH